MARGARAPKLQPGRVLRTTTSSSAVSPRVLFHGCVVGKVKPQTWPPAGHALRGSAPC